MSTRYQVFVSSTYLDLKEARQQVLHALLDLDCIPAGMELFSASSDEQFDYIKREIDESDYYVLILGWRYGSVHSDGVSYTEREFDYAIQQSIPVLVFPHADEALVAAEYRESDAAKRGKLLAFRERAMKARLAKHWKVPDELSIQVNKSLHREFRDHPRAGWIRADSGPDAKTLAEIVRLRQEKDELIARVEGLERAFPKTAIPNLAPLSATFRFSYTYYTYDSRASRYKQEDEATRTFQAIFAILAPSLLGPLAEEGVSTILATAVCQVARASSLTVAKPDIETIRIQLEALGLITAVSSLSIGKTQHVYWQLTEAGKVTMITLRTLKQ